jgi:hypothetical protein
MTWRRWKTRCQGSCWSIHYSVVAAGRDQVPLLPGEEWLLELVNPREYVSSRYFMAPFALSGVTNRAYAGGFFFFFFGHVLRQRFLRAAPSGCGFVSLAFTWVVVFVCGSAFLTGMMFT